MPKITDIEVQKNNKTRANVYIDGEFAFGLEMLTVMKLGLKTGAEVSESKLAEAVFDSEKTVAFDKAMDYLGRCMRTQRQMRDYLLKKGYSERVTRYVISKLADYKYIDDDAYAAAYAEQASANKGNRRIRQELMQKGISQEKADSVSLDRETSCKTAENLAVKYMKNKTADVKTLQKLHRFLLSRGYEYEIVNGIVRSYGIEAQD